MPFWLVGSRYARLVSSVLGVFLLWVTAPPTVTAKPTEAEIVLVIGKGERRDAAESAWAPASAKQTIKPGGFARTLELSQMALLLPDRTQVRLNQNSQMQIKTLADTAEWKENTVRLNAGRAWSQARPAAPVASSGAKPATLSMETPSSTLSIRGTDWEVEVSPDGRTLLVVFSGAVDMANEQGAVQVGAGEAASAAIGQAPTKILLANPSERTQWVTSWTPQPRRWLPTVPSELRAAVDSVVAGDLAMAARWIQEAPPGTARDVLSADLAAFRGDLKEAEGLLRPHLGKGAWASHVGALLARVLLASGQADAAAEVLEASQKSVVDHPEVWLARAEVALFSGNEAAARTALARALSLEPSQADALLLLGRIETERENVRPARRALSTALTFTPDNARVLAEQGALETFAGNLAEASRSFDKALSLAPDDYVALTARGIAKLRQGKASTALEDFLRSGLIEPRYARAWLYSAIAFYQMGEPTRAREALSKAAALDPRDPIPHLMNSLIDRDEWALHSAVENARRAQERMPFLKSLNQLLNDQKGSANLGSSLAISGLENWATHYAALAYSPWWAGSHLFMADRQAPGFNKNSALFKGFILDPTVFGASPRKSSLTSMPGHHGRIDLFHQRADWKQSALIGTSNGLVSDPVPLAYFFSGDLSDGRSRLAEDKAHGGGLTIGLGLRPSHSLGAFLFATDTRVRGNLRSEDLPQDILTVDDSRADFGLSYRHDSNNQFWLKAGEGRNDASVRGLINVSAFGVVPLNQFNTHIRQRDRQFRHAMSLAGSSWLSWGAESAAQDKPAALDLDPFPMGNLRITETGRLRSDDQYLLLRLSFSESLQGELGAWRQKTRFQQVAETRFNADLIEAPTLIDRGLREINARGGLRWRYSPLSSLSLIGQKWRRPAGVGSLSPIDTLGIPINDQVVTSGGLYTRSRLQIDHEFSSRTFAQAFVDRERIRNLTSPATAVVPDLELSQLDALRNRQDAFTFQPDLESPPAFLEGSIESFAVSLSQRWGTSGAFSMKYKQSDARQTGIRAGLSIPYVPRHWFRAGTFWSFPGRWLLGVNATWRSERFRDEPNTAEERIEAGWVMGLSAYWESADKRWVLQSVLDNLSADKRRVDERKAKATFRAAYQF